MKRDFLCIIQNVSTDTIQFSPAYISTELKKGTDFKLKAISQNHLCTGLLHIRTQFKKPPNSAGSNIHQWEKNRNVSVS